MTVQQTLNQPAKPAAGQIRRWLNRVVILYWTRPICRLLHRENHSEYWYEYEKAFFECHKCGYHFAKPRPLPEDNDQAHT